MSVERSLRQLVPLGVLDLAAEDGGRKHEPRRTRSGPRYSPASGASAAPLRRGSACQAAHDQVRLQEPVPGARRFQLPVRQNLERELKSPVEFILPLLGQAARADHEAALQIAAAISSFINKPAMMVLPAPGSSARRKRSGWSRQHGFVDGRNLVGQRHDVRSVNREDRIEEMGHPDALRLRDQSEERTVAIKAPWPPLLTSSIRSSSWR